MDKNKKIDEEVQPFLDWSLIQAGAVKFINPIEKQRLVYPQPQNVPYGISINSQEAKKTSIWLKAEKPWEAMRINGYLTVIYENGIYRLWYESLGADAHGDLDTRLCYAESPDGFSWKKPILNLIEYEGENINLVNKNGQVFIYGENGLELLSKKKEKQMGLRPFCTQISAKNIIGWKYGTVNGVKKLINVRIKDQIAVPSGKYNEELRNRIRVLSPGS